jgi:hypothetical protein
MAMAHNGCGCLMVEHREFKGPRAHRAGATLEWLTRRFHEIKDAGIEFDAVVFERPFARGMDATRCLWGLAGLVEAVASSAPFWWPVMDVTPAEIKNFATSEGGAGKGDMLAAAIAFGYCGDNEHEADAVCLLRYAEKYVARPGRPNLSKESKWQAHPSPTRRSLKSSGRSKTQAVVARPL